MAHHSIQFIHAADVRCCGGWDLVCLLRVALLQDAACQEGVHVQKSGVAHPGVQLVCHSLCENAVGYVEQIIQVHGDRVWTESLDLQ